MPARKTAVSTPTAPVAAPVSVPVAAPVVAPAPIRAARSKVVAAAAPAAAVGSIERVGDAVRPKAIPRATVAEPRPIPPPTPIIPENTPKYVAEIRLGLCPDRLPKKIREDPAQLAILEEHLGLAGLPASAKTFETCWRCLRGGKATYSDLPDGLAKKDKAEWERMAIFSADNDHGYPTSIYDSMSDEVIQAAYRALSRAKVAEKRAGSGHARSIWNSLKDGARKSKFEEYAFDHCGAELESYRSRDWLTPSRARRAFAEDRFGSLERLPVDVIPAETIMTFVSTKKEHVGPHFWGRMNEAMWEAAMKARTVSLDIVPLEMCTEDRLIAFVASGHESLDAIPEKLRTDKVKQAIIDREQKQKAAVEADAREKADTVLSLWKYEQADRAKKMAAEVVARTGNAVFEDIKKFALYTPEEADAVWKKRYDQALAFNHCFYGGTGQVSKPILSNYFKRAHVYRGTYPTLYTIADLERLDAADPDAHKPYNPPKVARVTKKTASAEDEESAIDGTSGPVEVVPVAGKRKSGAALPASKKARVAAPAAA